MAKGLRSTQNKSNNSKLRSDVFGPIEDARKERLSAKLLELIAKPKSKSHAEHDVEAIDERTGPSILGCWLFIDSVADARHR